MKSKSNIWDCKNPVRRSLGEIPSYHLMLTRAADVRMINTMIVSDNWIKCWTGCADLTISDSIHAAIFFLFLKQPFVTRSWAADVFFCCDVPAAASCSCFCFSENSLIILNTRISYLSANIVALFLVNSLNRLRMISVIILLYDKNNIQSL